MKSKSLSLSDRKPWIALDFSGWFSFAFALFFFGAYKYSNAAIPAGLVFSGLGRLAWLSGSAVETLSARIDLLEKANEEAENAQRPQT